MPLQETDRGAVGLQPALVQQEVVNLVGEYQLFHLDLLLAQRIGQVLHLATMQFTQGYINACFRLFPLTMTTVDNGREFRESGFVFEVHVCEQNQ